MTVVILINKGNSITYHKKPKIDGNHFYKGFKFL